MKRYVVVLCATMGVAACSGQSDGGPAVTARPDAMSAVPARLVGLEWSERGMVVLRDWFSRWRPGRAGHAVRPALDIR